jgi:hypothetical protein
LRDPVAVAWADIGVASSPLLGHDVGMGGRADLFSCDLSEVGFSDVEAFVDDAIAVRSQAESAVLELKLRRSGPNVVEVVAGMSNSDGGLVLVGVGEKEDPPIAGVPADEVDRIVQSLRQLPSDAMPEVVPFALPDGSGRVVVVIRVDADAVETPVVHAGRVLVRVPGHTVGASREQILALFHRPAVDGPGWAGSMPVDVGTVAMWPDGEPNQPLEVRAHAEATLPRRAGSSRWIGSRAFDRALGYLRDESPLRALLAEHARPHEAPALEWAAVEKASSRYRFRSSVRASPYRGSPDVVGSVFVTKAGRHLDVVTAIRVDSRADGEPLFADDGVVGVRDLLLAAALTSSAALTRIATAAGWESPMSSRRLTPWLGGERAIQVVNPPDRWDATVADRTSVWRWEPSPLASFDAASLEAVVAEWVSQLLFDLGATGFEDELAGWPTPGWHRDG